jgi:serine/threonine protein kinase
MTTRASEGSKHGQTCPDDETLARFAEGALAEEQASAVRAHATVCSMCAGLVLSSDELAAAENANARDGLEGARIGRYEIVGTLGAGGMGTVYHARDTELLRSVAIKFLRASSGLHDGKARLLREAKALASVSHPNVIAVYDAGTYGEEVFVALEMVTGTTLRQWLATEARSLKEIVRVLAEAGRGLMAVHEAGLVHRDFKPDNLLVSSRGVAKVADFGLAKFLEDEAEGTTSAASSPLMRTGALITRTGALIGTPAYWPRSNSWAGRSTRGPMRLRLRACFSKPSLESGRSPGRPWRRSAPTSSPGACTWGAPRLRSGSRVRRERSSAWLKRGFRPSRKHDPPSVRW